MLYLLTGVLTGDGRCGRLGGPLDLAESKFGDELGGKMVEGGEEAEPRVEEDLLTVGGVPSVSPVPLEALDSTDESLEDLSVLKLALERRRRSRKKGIGAANGSRDGVDKV